MSQQKKDTNTSSSRSQRQPEQQQFNILPHPAVCSFRLLQEIDLPISHFRNLTTRRTWLGILGLALGTNAKAAGSLNDFKDEKVLPRRYDNAIAYQEKLRQVSMIGICCARSTDTMYDCFIRSIIRSWSNSRHSRIA